MKKLLMMLPLAGVLAFSSCNAQSKEGENKTEQSAENGVVNKDVDAQEFAKLVAEGNGVVLDVRTDGEYAEGHIKGAKQFDFYSSDFKDKLKTLDPETPVYVYCRSGGRSGKAAHMMKGMGFKAVYNLEGGIGAWQRANQPVEQ